MWRFTRQQLVVGVSLVGFLVAVVGVPLPAYQLKSGKSGGQPYPCMGHACGCQDADHCWRDCCCFSQQEKLAWAKAHHVSPPSFLLVSVEHEEHEHGGRECCAGHGHRELAATKAATAAASLAGKPARRSCCHAADERCESGQEAKTAEPKSSQQDDGLAVVVVSNFRHCHGLPQLWSVLGASTAPPSAIHYAFDWLVVDWLSTISLTADSCASAPPTPPPLG